MGTVLVFPSQRRQPVPDHVRLALKKGAQELSAFEAAFGIEAHAHQGFQELLRNTDDIIATLFGPETAAREFVWRWLCVWCEVTNLSDRVATESESLKKAVEAALDAVFDRDRSVDTSQAALHAMAHHCMTLKDLDIDRYSRSCDL